MNVVLLGAGGTIAPALVHDLAASEEVSDLLLLDLDGERAAAVADAHGQGRARASAADARSGLAGVIEGADVLVNAASYRVNLEAMRACLAAGVHYIDLGGLYRMTGRQLELHSDFERAGLLALLGIGSSPGKTNLMAAKALRELGAEAAAGRLDLPGGVDSIDVSAAGRDLDPPQGFAIPYALQTLIDELTLAPVVLRDGRPVELEPLRAGGRVDFGEPIGEAETIHTLHSELRTFGDSFGCREASFRLSLPPPLLERLRSLAGADADEIAAAAREASPPSAKTVSVHLVEVSAGGASATMRAVTEPLAGWGLGGGVVSTAAPAAAAVRLLARGRIAARGALPPERCLDPDEVFAELEARGVSFELRRGESTAASVATLEGTRR
ncbi:MAG: hypothetical protein QOJ38_1076 [Solirubrobacterales bacterium]|jgi:saccharopine dehydrogenase-like NADP-dependent oxidoreductase|nr:hypothetical protein [Solirubrobacterales bacterium]